MQLHRVKSVRLEQETKIAQFLREDKFKSGKEVGEWTQKESSVVQKESPVGKPWSSVSPRKKKRIDKVRIEKVRIGLMG